MKNIDNIIKYLSGEMLPDENDRFRKEISENSGLRDEFESISSIWEEIRKQLLLKESPGSEDREQLIAEILAEHDIQFYGTKTETKKEEDFKKNLGQSMIESEKPEKVKKKLPPRIYSMISLMAAAMIISLIFILNPAPDINELTEAYYQPVSDPVFEKVNGTSRSGIGSAMALFDQGKYKAAQYVASEELIKYPDVLEIQLLYALASYEAGDLSTAKVRLLSLIKEDETDIADAAKWYLSLLFIQTDISSVAKPYLEDLNASENSYQIRAGKLLKKMK